VALIEAGYKVVIVDNQYNSSSEVINRIELLTGSRPEYYNVDITDEAALDKVFAAHPDVDSVIHFAALKVRGRCFTIKEPPISDYLRVKSGPKQILRAARSTGDKL
jgi:UDP-glucose 4-epimerase